MIFEDANKKYEIEFRMLRNDKYPTFTFTMIKPVNVSGLFQDNDIKKHANADVTGINFSSISKVSKALNQKSGVFVSLSEEAINFVRESAEQELPSK